MYETWTTFNSSSSTTSTFYGILGSYSSRLISISNLGYTVFFPGFFPFFLLAFSMCKINKLIKCQSIITNSNQMIKSSVNRSASNSIKNRPVNDKTQYTTGVSSQQRSQIHSFVKTRDSKNVIHVKKEEGSTDKNKQLFTVIQSFYSTLCELPLEKLVNSAEPQQWISQQEETLKTLSNKLKKVSKQKNQEYYRWKLKSLETILSNIRQNLAMLKRMNELKNYFSGTQSSNYHSSRCSSFDQSGKNIKLGQFATQNKSMKQMLNYDQYPIQNSQVPKSITSHCPEIMAQTVNSEEQQSSDQEHLTQSQIKSKKNTKRTVIRSGQNHNTSNKMSFVQKNKSNIAHDLKDKTLTKVNVVSSKSQSTLNNLSTQNRYKTNQNFHLSNQQTKRSQIIKQDSSFKMNTMPNQYIDLIKQLRLELLQKDKEIQRLLINQQEFQETMEIFQSREKEKNMEILFLKENAANNQRQKQKLLNEIRKLGIQADDLKETVRLERQRYKKEERQKDKVQQKLQEQTQEKQEFLSEIERLKEENKIIKKSQRQMKQKLQIYTRKYFNLYGTVQTMKEQITLLSEQLQKQRQRCKTQSNYQAVKKIIDYHKQKICSQSFEQ